jgi:hypothetical protein
VTEPDDSFDLIPDAQAVYELVCRRARGVDDDESGTSPALRQLGRSEDTLRDD